MWQLANTPSSYKDTPVTGLICCEIQLSAGHTHETNRERDEDQSRKPVQDTVGCGRAF